MAFAAFEIQKLLNGNGDDALSRKQSRFPRTARMRALLIGVVTLALVVFGLNLIESSRIPSAEKMGRGQTKNCRDGSSECDETTSNSADDGNVVVTTPLQGQKDPQISTLPPTQSPVLIPGGTPSPMLWPGNAETPGQIPVSEQDPSALGGEPSLSQTNPQNEVPDFAYPEALVPVMNNSSQAFVERWCDLRGTDWYPKDGNAWKKRAPAFLIPGAKYSGIFAITNLLDEHPQIRPPSKGPETRFFFEPDFLRYVQSNEKTTVMQARERLLAVNYPAAEFRDGIVSYDASSGYLFRSTVLPRRLLCVLPWIKIVAVLRDPIERLFVHYSAMKFDHSLPHQLEDWIEKDMNLMRQANLIPNATSTGKQSMKDEDVAWYDYQHNAVEGPVGRSLYDIQLRQWFQALRAIGRNPKDCVLIVRTEELVENPKREFDRILKFLDLSEFTPSSWDIVSSIYTQQTGEMSKETQKWLSDFFKPYQARLEKLLKKFKVPYGSGSATPRKVVDL